MHRIISSYFFSPFPPSLYFPPTEIILFALGKRHRQGGGKGGGGEKKKKNKVGNWIFSAQYLRSRVKFQKSARQFFLFCILTPGSLKKVSGIRRWIPNSCDSTRILHTRLYLSIWKSRKLRSYSGGIDGLKTVNPFEFYSWNSAYLFTHYVGNFFITQQREIVKSWNLVSIGLKSKTNNCRADFLYFDIKQRYQARKIKLPIKNCKLPTWWEIQTKYSGSPGMAKR